TQVLAHICTHGHEGRQEDSEEKQKDRIGGAATSRGRELWAGALNVAHGMLRVWDCASEMGKTQDEDTSARTPHVILISISQRGDAKSASVWPVGGEQANRASGNLSVRHALPRSG